MRILATLFAAGILLAAGARADEVASAEEVASTGSEAIDESLLAAENSESEDAIPHEPNTIIRVKSGISFPKDNGEVSHLIPVTLDWEYLGFNHLAVGASFSWMSGSGPVQNPLPGRPAGSELNKSMALALASVGYRYQSYPVRISAGLRAGWLFYRESTTPPAGSGPYGQPLMHSLTPFAAGPAANFDFHIRGPYFASLGGQYLFAENSLNVGSIQVGVGAEF